MKKQIIKAIFTYLILVTVILLCVACNKGGDEIESTDAPTESVADLEETTEPPLVVAEPEFLATPDYTYLCQDDSVLNTYNEKTVDDFDSVYVYYSYLGYESYSQSRKNGSEFATLVNGTKMTHIYYLADRGELNVVTSDTAGASLPPKTPESVDGEHEVTVTQLRDDFNVNGMGYIIRLADGSYIIYDGAYESQTSKIMQYLNLTSGNNDIVIRAWVLTHSHEDHYPAFREFASRYATRVKLEYVIFAPIDAESAIATGGDTYFNDGLAEDIAKFKGAKTVFAHTGMEFTFCNLKMEVLLTADDLFKTYGHGMNFNNTSIVTRLYDENYSFLLTADTAILGSEWLVSVYGDYLKSDMCQVSHHGVEDVPVEFYDVVKAPILYYPCNQYLYDLDWRFGDVRAALREREYTKEILIAGLDRFTRAWGTTFDADAELSMPKYTPTVTDVE